MTASLATLVTGSSSGLGMEIARRLSATRRLILGGRDAERLERTRQACARPDEHIVWPMDLVDVPAITPSLTALLAAHDVRIDGFVHCAGMLKLMRFRMMDLAAATETMNVNFMSAVEIVKLLLKKPVNDHQLKGVVFISSTASQFGAKGFNMYCASKGALDALMRALAVELAPTVRLNSVLPGAVRTEMTGAMFADPALKANIEKDYPLGVGEPSDIAAAVEFLLSDDARWITGQQMVVDGGRTVNITA